MFVEKRAYSVQEIADIATLAHILTRHKWSLCAGFKVGRLIFVNDSSPGSEAIEYAVIREVFTDDAEKEWTYYQVESFTVSNMNPLEFRIAAGRVNLRENTTPELAVDLHIESVEKHTCHKCG